MSGFPNLCLAQMSDLMGGFTRPCKAGSSCIRDHNLSDYTKPVLTQVAKCLTVNSEVLIIKSNAPINIRHTEVANAPVSTPSISASKIIEDPFSSSEVGLSQQNSDECLRTFEASSDIFAAEGSQEARSIPPATLEVISTLCGTGISSLTQSQMSKVLTVMARVKRSSGSA
jgi:hypothetical protein